jgi:hypothetical protein
MTEPKVYESSKHIGTLCVRANKNVHTLGAKLGIDPTLLSAARTSLRVCMLIRLDGRSGTMITNDQKFGRRPVTIQDSDATIVDSSLRQERVLDA